MAEVNWDRLWRGSGITFVILFIISYAIYGSQPKADASPDRLVSFYDDHRGRILIAGVLLGMAALNLLWFAAALASALRDAGQGIWGAAVTASSAALGAVFFVLITVNAALAYSIAGSQNDTSTSGLHDLALALAVDASFPVAMLIMAGTFGLWQTGIVSNAIFCVGLLAVILVLLGATTWATDGFWAPDGAYSRFIWPIIALVWIAAVSGLLYVRAPERASSASS